MAQYLIEMFGVSLLLTWAIELAVAGLLKVAPGKDWLPVVLVNLFTNPAVVFLCWVWGIYVPKGNSMWIQLPLELLVIWIEFRIYNGMVKSGWNCRWPLKLSVMANIASWLFGVGISMLR